MRRYLQTIIEDIEVSQLTDLVAKGREEGWRFIQLCATTLEDSLEILYSFNRPDDLESVFSYRLNVADGEHVPSITPWFPAAFVYENEAHDLFGVPVDGISIDFEGDFYRVAVAYPMNPRASKGEEAQDE